MKRLALILLLALPSLAWSQNDFFNRNEIGLKIKPTKRFSATLSGQYRWNVSEKLYSKTLFTARLKYDIAKPFSILATYRRTWMPNEFFYLDNQENTSLCGWILLGHFKNNQTKSEIKFKIYFTIPKRILQVQTRTDLLEKQIIARPSHWLEKNDSCIECRKLFENK